MNEVKHIPQETAAGFTPLPVGLTTEGDLVALGNGVNYINAASVEGHVAEFGCFKGRSSAVLSWALRFLEPRELWLFDSFQGMPVATEEIDINSPDVESGAWVWRADVSPDDVRAACAKYLPEDRIRVFPGWFDQTLPTIPADTRFAMVHLDCDLYLSTIQVLEHLFRNKLLSDGATLFFDDWYCNRANPLFGQQQAWRKIKSENFYGGYSYTNMGPYGLVGHRYIIHRWA